VNAILKKINFITTPVILKYDSNYAIIDAYFPQHQKSEQIIEFISNND